MMYTDEFFLSGLGQNSSLVQLVDSFTEENVNFKKVSTWIDGSFLVVNDPRVLDDNIIYRQRGNDYYVNTVVFSTKRVYVTTFGAMSSYDSDQRIAIQKALDVCSKLGLKLVFPSGNFLIKSYSDKTSLAIEYGNILELRSDLDIEFEDNSTIKLDGETFDDKGFILFSGLNSECLKDLSPLYNISLKGKGIIDFDGENSKMRTSYIRRIGFEGGKCSNIRIEGITWTNGDLSNCIAVGNASTGSNVNIQNCIFNNLATSNKNINHDHSTIYGDVDYLSVHDNLFIGNTLMSLIGCACEIHGSFSSFHNNKVYEYTRLNFIATSLGERTSISDISINDNIAEIANSAVYIWSDKDCSISDVTINNNNIKHKHIQGESQNYNGYQCLFNVMDKKGKYERIIATNNFCHILFTIGDHLRYAVVIGGNTNMLEICNNQFVGHSLGILFDKEPDTNDYFNYSLLKISNNNFSSSSKLVTINAKKVVHSLISNNSTTLALENLENLIEINSDTIQSTVIKDNIYLNNNPKVEFIPSSIFKGDSTNKAKYFLSLISTPVPTINVGEFGLIIPSLSDSHKRVGGKYNILPTYPFYELFFHTHTFGAGGTAEVKFKVDNLTSSIFSANPDLVSNILVDI